MIILVSDKMFTFVQCSLHFFLFYYFKRNFMLWKFFCEEFCKRLFICFPPTVSKNNETIIQTRYVAPFLYCCFLLSWIKSILYFYINFHQVLDPLLLSAVRAVFIVVPQSVPFHQEATYGLCYNLEGLWLGLCSAERN